MKEWSQDQYILELSTVISKHVKLDLLEIVEKRYNEPGEETTLSPAPRDIMKDARKRQVGSICHLTSTRK